MITRCQYLLVISLTLLVTKLHTQEPNVDYFNCFGTHFGSTLSHYGSKVGGVYGSYKKIIEGTYRFDGMQFNDLEYDNINSSAKGINYRLVHLNSEGYIISQCFSSTMSFDSCLAINYSLDNNGKILGYRSEFLNPNGDVNEKECVRTYNLEGYLENVIYVGSHFFKINYLYSSESYPKEIEIIGESVSNESYTIRIYNISMGDQKLTFSKELVSCINCTHNNKSFASYDAEFYFNNSGDVVRSIEIFPNGRDQEFLYQYSNGNITRIESHDKNEHKTVIQYFYEQNRLIRKLITSTIPKNKYSPAKVSIGEFLYKEHNENDDWTKEIRRNLKTGELETIILRTFEE